MGFHNGAVIIRARRSSKNLQLFSLPNGKPFVDCTTSHLALTSHKCAKKHSFYPIYWLILSGLELSLVIYVITKL